MNTTLLKIVGTIFLVGGILLTLPVGKIIGGVLMLAAALCTFVYIAFKPKGK